MKTELLTENRIIAEFMGQSNTWLNGVDGLYKYDTSWDWLMPVIQKIAEYRLAYPEQTSKVCDCKVVVSIKYLYPKVVEFIKWYNSNPELLKSQSHADNNS